MKKLLTFATLLFLGSVATAQELTIKRDTAVSYDEDRYRVITNKFWDNWFIGAGAGAQMYFGDHNKQMKFSDRLTPAFNAYVGKWFSPVFGVRAGITGLKVKGATQDISQSTGEKYPKEPWGDYRLYKRDLKYYNLSGDALFNVSNLFGGYKERVYEFIPYVGLGWMFTKDQNPNQREVAANVGILNNFRLSKAVNLTLDVRGAMVNDRFDGIVGERREDGLLSATLGLAYKFKQRGWEKPKTIVIKESYDQAELQSILDRLKQLTNDNEALKQQLANAKTPTITNIDIKKNMLAAPILITFPINKATVSNEARVNLGFFAKLIKETNPEFTYSVTGYADKGTGTAEINERLSRERADAIYKILVNEFGVNKNQLKVDYKGGVSNMFYDDPRLSRAVITIADLIK